MEIDTQKDPFTLTPEDVREILGLVDRKRAELISQLGGAGTADILKQINVRFHDVGDERRVTVAMPPGMSFKEIYEAINDVSGRKQDGVWKEGSLMAGPQDDHSPVGEQSFTIHFGANHRNRDEQAAYLRDKGQGFADPWVVAMAEAAQLAKHGLRGSLFRIQGTNFWVRAEKSANIKCSPVWDLRSDDDGVCDDSSYVDYRNDANMIAVGSSNPIA